jgi:hypothetical protein
MGRTEARIFTSIWRDKDFTGLPPGAQRLYMFLLSQDDLAYCGVMPLRPPRWASKAAGMTVADIDQDLKALVVAPSLLIIPDWDTGELMVRSLMRRDGIWKQPNLLKQARESAEQVESAKIRSAMLQELRRLPLEETASEQVRTLVADFIRDLDQGTAYPAANPDPNPAGNPKDDPSGDPSAKDNACARGTGESYVAVLGFPDPPVPLSPTDLSAQSRKNGSRLPADFTVTPDMVAWARQHAPHVDGKRETERFTDHFNAKAGKDGRKLDWIATWRNWMRTAEDRQGPRDRGPSGTRVATTDQRVADAQTLKAQMADPAGRSS